MLVNDIVVINIIKYYISYGKARATVSLQPTHVIQYMDKWFIASRMSESGMALADYVQ